MKATRKNIAPDAPDVSGAPAKPDFSAAHRAHLAFLGALQVSDLFDALMEIDTNIEGYEAVVAAIAARGSALTGVILGAMNDKLADEEAMIRKLALRKDVNAFRAKLRDSLPWME